VDYMGRDSIKKQALGLTLLGLSVIQLETTHIHKGLCGLHGSVQYQISFGITIGGA